MPFGCSERAKVLLTSAAYVHLKHFDVSKHARNLSPASRVILLSGPTGMWSSYFSTSNQTIIQGVFGFLTLNLFLFGLLSVLQELYLQTLAKALAHDCEAKLLILDITDFSLKVIM